MNVVSVTGQETLMASEAPCGMGCKRGTSWEVRKLEGRLREGVPYLRRAR